ncbi:MAG: coproporphyrinogen dehydrogenase HemZ [Peptococcales bacterium]|jgi:oxygen-independent coproporphyrinogen-3 oxidase
MKISLSYESKNYASTVFDTIRIFLPHLTWQDLTNGALDTNLFLIKEENNEVVVGLWDGPKLHETISDEDNNETKRTIKYTVYRYFTEILKFSPSPWGILTGIRPTKIVHRYWDQGLTEKEIQELLEKKFILTPSKAQKLIQITKIQRKYLLAPEEAQKSVSVYISIPFCPTRCSYCSFPAFAIGRSRSEISQYLKNLVLEIQEVGKALQKARVNIQTIYVGGGTPSALNLVELEFLLKAINQYLFTDNIEYTFEAGRPDTIDEEKLALLKDYHVNRISINPQTMWEKTLEKVGRKHTPQDIIDKFNMTRGLGFANINMDLIVGLPGEGLLEFKYTLKEISKLKPENLTVHALAIKRTAQLKEQQEDLKENQAQDMFFYLEKWCEENFYLPYYLYRQKHILGNLENVGYSLGEKPCIYNIQMIEERQTIWGLGVGSGSKIVNPLDWTLLNKYNPKDLGLYNQRIKEIIQAKVDKIQTLG